VQARARSRPIWRARSIGRAGTDERRSVPRRHGDGQSVALVIAAVALLVALALRARLRRTSPGRAASITCSRS
jgi:hypothetical protein